MKQVFVEDDAPSSVDENSCDIRAIIGDIRGMLGEGREKEDIDEYLSEVYKKLDEDIKVQVDKSALKEVIMKHPFFKNPNDYHIRLITILKYLKKKSMFVDIEDFDLIVDDVIQSISNVKKISEGKYKIIK